MPWLIELIGPQHAGKSTIVNLLSFTLESNRIPALWVETDKYVFSLFPAWRKLRSLGEREKADRLLDERWPFFHDVIGGIIQKGLAAGYTVMHDHVNTRPFRKGRDRRIAKRTGARHLSVMVTAPLGVLKARWDRTDIRKESVKGLLHDYSKFEKIRQEGLCDLVIDTSVTGVEQAVKMILSVVYPNIKVDVERVDPLSRPQTADRAEKAGRTPIPAVVGMPRLSAGLQLYRESDVYMLVYKHETFLTDDIGTRIINLCDGTNTVNAIARKTKIDLATVRRAVGFMSRTDIVKLLPNK